MPLELLSSLRIVSLVYTLDATEAPLNPGQAKVHMSRSELSVSLFDSVSDYMVKDFLKVLSVDSIVDASRKMRSANTTEAIVVREEDPIGIVTERDVLYRVVAAGLDPSLTKVLTIMSFPIQSIEKNAGVGEALLKMVDLGIRRLGVTEKGKFIGLITYKSILFPNVISQE